MERKVMEDVQCLIGEGFDGKKTHGRCSMFDVRDSFSFGFS
jgi:hypothetical protein